MTTRKFMIGLLALLVIALMMAPSLMAQSLVSGDLTGTVTDPSGAVVSGASVSLKSDATGQTRNATTNGSGAYRFSNTFRRDDAIARSFASEPGRQ